MAQLKVQQKKSSIGCKAKQRETLRTAALVVIGIGFAILLGSMIPLFSGVRARSNAGALRGTL